jgi:hypothetical protein
VGDKCTSFCFSGPARTIPYLSLVAYMVAALAIVQTM